MIRRRALVFCFHKLRVNEQTSRCYSLDYIVKSNQPDITLPDIPLHRFVWRNINKWPHSTAIECAVSGKKYTYAELYLKCKTFSKSLRKLGLKNGDHISICLPNIPEYPIALFGAIESGVTANTINPSYTKDELQFYLDLSDSMCVICHPSNVDTILHAKKAMKKSFKVICTRDIDGSWPPVRNELMEFETLIDNSEASSGDDENESIDLSTTALVAHSSGTTGLPKGVCLTHRSITANIAQFSSTDKFIETSGSHQDVIPGILPFFHVYGSIIILAAGLLHGSRIVTLPSYNRNGFLNILANNRNINLFLVPPLLFFLGKSDLVSDRHLRGIREIMLGAAACGANDLNIFRKKVTHDIPIVQAYGLTESSPLLTVNDNEGLKSCPSSVGKLLPNTWSKVRDTESNQVLPPNSPGELCFKGPQLMKGYLNNARATHEATDPDGYIRSGDIGYYDENGYFYITDRLKDLIKVNGYQVAPAELEEVLRKYPGIVEAGVVGIPSQLSGESPVAFVQTQEETKITEEEIKTFIRSQLSKHKHLSSVQFVPYIPKTPSGKILRKNLKTMIL